MNSDDKNAVWIDTRHPPLGRFDPERVGKYNPNDTEPRPVTTPEELEASRQLGIKEGWYKPRERV